MANDQVLAAGRAIAAGLAVIGVVQRGASYALNGRVDVSGLLKFLLTASLVIGMLEWWGTPFPGLAMTPPEVVSGMGRWLVDQTVGTLGDDTFGAIRRLWDTFTYEDTGFVGQLWTVITGGAAAAIGAAATFYAGTAMLLLAIGAAIAAMAQVIWAGVAIGICVLFGPVLVPWLLFQPLSFLFWGWLKTLLVYSLYGPIAVAVLHIFIRATLGQAELVMTTGGWADGGGQALVSILTGLLLAATSIMAVIKIPALANGLVTGSGAAGSGIAEATTMVATQSVAATAAGGAQRAASGLAGAGLGIAQPSIAGGAPIGTAGSRVFSGAVAAAAGGLAGAAGMAQGRPVTGGALPVTKRRSP